MKYRGWENIFLTIDNELSIQIMFIVFDQIVPAFEMPARAFKQGTWYKEK